MRKKNYKGRVTKRYLPKCNDICRTYDPIMTAYADLVSKMEEVEEFRCNTADELIKKIREVDWDKVVEEVRPRAGAKIDFGV